MENKNSNLSSDKSKSSGNDKKLSLLGWIVYILYNLIWLTGFPFLLLIVLVKSLFKKEYQDGYLRKLTIKLPCKINKKSILIYGVSGGEMAVGSELAKSISGKTDCTVIIATHTKDGFDMATKKLKDTQVKIEYHPYDFAPLVRRFVNRINPCLLLILETEIWPSLLTVNALRGTPVLMVNGRIYENDFKTYRLLRWLFKPTLELYTKFLTQSEEDMKRLIDIGAPIDLVEYTGNMKFDIKINTADKVRINRIKESISNFENKVFLMLPSTHKGEEVLLLDAYLLMKKKYPDVCLILAPRHLNRIDEIKDILDERGVSYTQISNDRINDKDVILVDTFGELMYLYPLSQLVIMGGSFTKSIGGHNILEPAIYGVPVITGKYYHNFNDIVKRFVEKGAIKIIYDIDPPSVASFMIDFLNNKSEYEIMGNKGKDIIQNNQGVTNMITDKALSYL